jgi:hypothetical protein
LRGAGVPLESPGREHQTKSQAGARGNDEGEGLSPLEPSVMSRR